MPALSGAADIRSFIAPTEAKLALSCLCLIQAITTAVIDLNRTHATNPLWTGHARFHVVWQSCAVVFLSAVELILIWLTAPGLDGRFYLAALLAALSPMGVLTAFLSRKFFAALFQAPTEFLLYASQFRSSSPRRHESHGCHLSALLAACHSCDLPSLVLPCNQTSIVCPASSTRKLDGSICLRPS
jgi:hypothetical protein